jgi:hypothetical protein
VTLQGDGAAQRRECGQGVLPVQVGAAQIELSLDQRWVQGDRLFEGGDGSADMATVESQRAVAGLEARGAGVQGNGVLEQRQGALSCAVGGFHLGLIQQPLCLGCLVGVGLGQEIGGRRELAACSMGARGAGAGRAGNGIEADGLLEGGQRRVEVAVGLARLA